MINKKNIVQDKDLNEREIVMLNSARKFFKNKANLDVMIPIIQCEPGEISLRLLDWFVTNYCKENKIIYNTRSSNGKIEPFDAFQEYSIELNTYSKFYFDPFCRDRKIIFTVLARDKDSEKQTKVSFETAVCQLNFFVWAIGNNVIGYVKKHIEEIIRHMNSVTCKNKRRKALISQTDTSDEDSDIVLESDDELVSSDNVSRCLSSSDKGSSSDKKKVKRMQLTKSSYKGVNTIEKTIRLDFS